MSTRASRVFQGTHDYIQRTVPRGSRAPASEVFWNDNREALTNRKHLLHAEMSSQFGDLVALETQNPNGQIDPSGAFPG